jgi:hypothetical protein
MAINLNLGWDIVRKEMKNSGYLKTLNRVAFNVVNRFLLFRILKCVTIRSVNQSYLGSNFAYIYEFLGDDLLYELAKSKENQLPQEFVRGALEKGDECFGIMDGDTLASFGWYSNKPTLVSFGSAEDDKSDLCLHFAGDHVYMYNGYTNDNYRGQRLHAIGMTRALKAYLARDFKGIVSYVEYNNYASLNSCYRMGYKDFGKIYILKIFGKYIIRHTKGCKEFDFRVEYTGN